MKAGISVEYSELLESVDSGPNRVRLDSVDRVIVSELVADARISNRDLAERAGVAPSTCLARVQRLRTAGVIRGFHADVDLSRLGVDVAALVTVRIAPAARARMAEFARNLAAAAQVANVYLLGGDRDVLVHVVAADTAGLQAFVTEYLSGPEVVGTQTVLVFQHWSWARGPGAGFAEARFAARSSSSVLKCP